MWDILYYLFVIIVLAAAVIVGGFFLRNYLNGVSPTQAIFGPRPERRLELVDQSNLDGRRRLVLIRRDDVEHLIMTGGPVDVVIETNIAAARRPAPAPAADSAEPTSPVFSRQPRTLGQAVGD